MNAPTPPGVSRRSEGPTLQRAERADLLRSILVALLGSTLAVGVIELPYAPLGSLILVPLIALVLGLLGLVRVGRIDLAALLLVVGIGALLGALTFAGGGSEAGLPPLLVLVAVIGAWVLGRRAGLVLTAGAIALQLGEFVLGSTNALQVVDQSPEQAQFITTLALLFPVGLLTSWAVAKLGARSAALRLDTARLQRSREYATRVLRGLGEAVLVTDDALVVVEANRAAVRLLGSTAEAAIVGKPVPPLLTANANRGDGSLVTADGAEVPVRWSRTTLTDDRGQVRHVWVLSDDRARRETELRVEAAARAAERAEQAREQFLNAVSHELRTPLNAVMGYAELLVEELGEDIPSAADARRVQDAARLLLGLVGDVLDVSRGTEKAHLTRLSAADLAELARATTATMRPLADRRGNTLTVHLAAGTPPAMGDARLVRQVLMNLVSNAVKFTRDGAIDVEIAAAGAGEVAVSVRDLGIGIPADRLQQVFEPFVQVHHPGSGSGTGLGLSLCRQFATWMGGRMTAASVVGRGSTFSLVLPAA